MGGGRGPLRDRAPRDQARDQAHDEVWHRIMFDGFMLDCRARYVCITSACVSLTIECVYGSPQPTGSYEKVTESNARKSDLP